MISELEVLKQRITELEAENIKVKAKNAELRQAIREHTEHKARIKELEKNSADVSAENVELKARVAKLEQRQSQNPDNTSNNNTSNNISSNFNSGTDHHEEGSQEISASNNANAKSAEDDRSMSFLIKNYK